MRGRPTMQSFGSAGSAIGRRRSGQGQAQTRASDRPGEIPWRGVTEKGRETRRAAETVTGLSRAYANPDRRFGSDAAQVVKSQMRQPSSSRSRIPAFRLVRRHEPKDRPAAQLLRWSPVFEDQVGDGRGTFGLAHFTGDVDARVVADSYGNSRVAA